MKGAQTHINANVEIPAFIKRINALEMEMGTIRQDVASVYKEAKAKGFDKKALKEVIKQLKKAPQDRDEFTSTVEYYMDVVEGKK